ncbi:MAG: P-II family nitrogen regulator [Leptospirales bacterium]|nr:P-II family nitrogen regulator [Leptospirales bacterium]
MKLITAIIQPHKLRDVKASLQRAGVAKMTVFSAVGCGQQRGYDEGFRGARSEVTLLNKTVLQIAVNEEFVEPTIKAICQGARSGQIGDGKIFVTELKEVVRIRTGERGQDAIG